MRKPKSRARASSVRPVIEFPARLTNPFRETSLKHDALEIYRRGGPRNEIKKQMLLSLGIAPGTADAWISQFMRIACAARARKPRP